MAEPKPIASLSSGLLARKGTARPAMRRQGVTPLSSESIGQDDLGWNDMGYDVDPPKDGDRSEDNVSHHHGSLLAGAIPPTLAVAETGEAEDEAVAADEYEDTETAEAADTVDAEAPVAAADEPVLPEVVRQRETLESRISEAGHAVESDFGASVEDEIADDYDPNRQVLSIKPGKAVAASPASASITPIDMVRKAPEPVAKGKRAAFTLRVDPERHLRLRLASAITGQSAQQLVTAALDDLLTKIPDIEAMADQLAKSSAR
ncbi:MAG: hypothetical protein R3E02_09540 [Blastomonas sp.]